MIPRLDALRAVTAAMPDAPTVVTCGLMSRELASLGVRDNHLYALNSMGLAVPIGLGLALAGHDKVVVLEGDGGLLMGLGILATAGALQPAGLVVVLLDNGAHGSTGFQATAAAVVDLGALAEAAGLRVIRVSATEDLDGALAEARDTGGPTVVHVRIEASAAPGIPYLNDDPATIAARFRVSLTRPCGGEGR